MSESKKNSPVKIPERAAAENGKSTDGYDAKKIKQSGKTTAPATAIKFFALNKPASAKIYNK